MPTKPTARRCVLCGKANAGKSGGAFFHTAEIAGRQRSLPSHLACYRRWVADGAIVPPASNLAAWLARASAPPAPLPVEPFAAAEAFARRGVKAQAAVNAILGRPSAIRGKSASVTFRLTPALRGRLEARAKDLGVSLSDTIAMVLDAGLAGGLARGLVGSAAAQASAYAGAAEVTDAQIEALRAAAAGDRLQIRICDRALRGIAKDRANCARMIANDRAAAAAKEGGRP